MKRNNHTFQFNGVAIARAAKAEAEYHAQRAAWWSEEYEKAAVEAKAAGVQIREYDVTGGKRADVVIDPTVGKRLSEATNKLQGHKRDADQFAIEAATYGSQPDRMYELDGDDVMHFRLAGGARDD